MQDLRCTVPEHNKKKFISISLNDQAEKRLYCFQCQSDQTGKLSQSQIMNTNQLSDLDEVMEGNQYTVYNWPCDAVGKEIKETLMQYKSPEQQKKDIEDFFASLKQKLFEQIENIKGLLIETLTSTQFIKDEKKDIKQEEKKDEKKDDKKDTKKDDKKDTKKDDKKDTKKDDKKDTKKDDKQELKQQDQIDKTVSVENLKRLYDNVYDLVKIKQLIKENAKSDPKALTDKLSEYLNDQKRKEALNIMKNIYDQFKKSNNNKIGIPTNREQLDQFKEQVEKGLAQWPQFFGKLDWKFEISKADDSTLIKQIVNGIEFQGGSQKSQIIYSNKQFTEGQHGCVVMFTEFDQRRATSNGNFIVGLVSEENKDKGPYGQDLRKCLFTGNGEGMITKIGTDFNNTFKIAPKILAIKLDVENDYLEVSDGKRSVVYGLERETKLKGKKWRIYLMWREAADKIKLIHSY